MTHRSWAEPYKIKMVEPIRMTTREFRDQAIRDAGYNTFLLRSEDVYIDLLTDSGTSAMSDYQWAGLMLGDEAYAGSKSFYHLVDAVREVYGYEELIPTHQGRGAEHILSQILIEEGDVVPGNMYFTTTRFHQEYAGGSFTDVIIDEAHQPASEYPFKGNIDLAKLRAVVDEYGADRIPYVSFETNVNLAGGQPASMANFRDVYEFCAAKGILVMLDATRALENAYFIQQREGGYHDKSVKEILAEICSYSDGATVSSKKDNLVNIGGFLAVRDPDLARQARSLLVAFEGLHTYGGMSGRDMEAMARGIHEMVEHDEHVAARVGQVQYLGDKLIKADVPIVRPVGGHGIFLDAAAVLPHLPQAHFPAQALTAALYVDAGVRGMERGIVSAGRDPATGEHHYPKLELVRLAIPRRVYTQAHMDVAAESVVSVYEDRETISGLRFTYEPSELRFFQARFEPLS
ncbi:MAG: tyrosine phenol-lyase [Acidimicrobiia bacterium]|nr:tyrosine phenol-lyase [Acidimicrobiia bacterium]MDH3396967.1 tyrosine phenol-lyase [Acidimicrobiia bacterium]MDH5616389.1 tyrosine phenol-lyase [Acidimicrobiia bacterium]